MEKDLGTILPQKFYENTILINLNGAYENNKLIPCLKAKLVENIDPILRSYEILQNF